MSNHIATSSLETDVAKYIVTALTKHLVSVGIDKTVKVLREFAHDITPGGIAQTDDSSANIELPTAGIIGIGRCGTHIALDLAKTIYIARQELSKANQEASPENRESDKIKTSSTPSLYSLLPFLRRSASEKDSGLLLIDPVILAADLDGNVKGTVDHSDLSRKGDGKIRFALTDLTWLQKGGAGNIPIVAQYLATLALLIPEDQLPEGSHSWKLHRSYFIESAGLHDNASRLFIFLFSCGGGSGSGMASALGVAQQNAMLYNILGRPRTGHPDENANHYKIAEPICSLGIGIMPELTEIPSAQQLNAGRLLCRFLAQQNRFDLVKGESGESDGWTRMFNSLLLVSNWTMLKSFNGAKDDGTASVAKAEMMANHYIGQQIFNLLAAQALISDYDQGDHGKALLNEAGIADTIRLDANDLNNSLSGPTAVAYAEGFPAGTHSLVDLLARALAMPTVNHDETLIEGISILPTHPEKYRSILTKPRDEAFKELKELRLFAASFSIVCVLSVPKLEMLQMNEVISLREALETLFPSAKIKRYAVVQGSSRNPSLTLFIVGSACLTYEAHNHILRYIANCFGKPESTVQKIGEALSQVLSNDTFDPKPVLEHLESVESLGQILVGVSGSQGQWKMNKLTYEQRYASYLSAHNDDKSITPSLEIEQLLVTEADLKDTMEYMHRVRHQKPLRQGLFSAD